MSELSVTYGLRALASVPANIEIAEGLRECRIIIKDAALKDAGKCSQYCQLPEVTEGKVQAFIMNPKGLEAVKDFIAGLEDKAVRKIYVESHRPATASDLGIEELADIAAAAAENTRVTKESVAAWFADKVKDIANFLATSRCGTEAMKQEGFWTNGEGVRMVQIAHNYKIPVMELAAKNPAYTQKEIKDKLELVCAAVMTGTAFEEKLLAKLQRATIATIDYLAL